MQRPSPLSPQYRPRRRHPGASPPVRRLAPARETTPAFPDGAATIRPADHGEHTSAGIVAPSREAAWCRALLADLCRLRSTAGHERLLFPHLLSELSGLRPDVLAELPVDRTRANLLAAWGRPRVLFTTHLDVVPAAGWHEAFRPLVDGGGIVARGSCDAKGQVVSQVAAVRRLLHRGLRDVAWLGVVDEEHSSAGARAVASRPPVALCGLEAIVNGEPTDNVLASAQLGYQRWELECRAESGHASGGSARGAISDLVRWLDDFRDAAQRRRGFPLPFGRESFNVGRICGGDAPNMVASHARAEVVLRTLPTNLAEPSLAELLERCRPAGAELRLEQTSPPLVLGTWESLPSRPVSFGSDASHLRSLVPPGRVAMVGPGSIDQAHTAREQLRWSELQRGIDVLEDVGARALAGDLPGGGS